MRLRARFRSSRFRAIRLSTWVKTAGRRLMLHTALAVLRMQLKWSQSLPVWTSRIMPRSTWTACRRLSMPSVASRSKCHWRSTTKMRAVTYLLVGRHSMASMHSSSAVRATATLKRRLHPTSCAQRISAWCFPRLRTRCSPPMSRRLPTRCVRQPITSRPISS